MFSGRPSAAMGQRQKTQYTNRFTEFFFTEYNRGMDSPYFMVFTFTAVSAFTWKLFSQYIVPMQKENAKRPLVSPIPLSDTHQAFWGFQPSRPTGHRAESITQEVEDNLQRPVLVHSEHSESSSSSDIVVLEMTEYDRDRHDDVFYRSVHYMNLAPTKEKKKGDKEGTSESEAPQSATLGHIHGMAKCKGITSMNNCVPEIGVLSDESSRKLMLSLGPVHILRDVAKLHIRWRFTYAKELTTKALVCGLRGGELSRWMAAAFPNFEVDTVESDGALVRVCRKFLGFQEHNNLHLFVADPVEYLRRTSVKEIDKKYDLVVLDCVDGSNELRSNYGRLEFINSVRQSMSNAGVVVVNIPNRDPGFLYNVVQNWRMGFHMRTVLLFHCTTTDNTILMTFQDNADRGKTNFGTVGNFQEFRDVINTQSEHYGHARVKFSLPDEVNAENFRVLEPLQQYSLEQYLPVHHPLLLKSSPVVNEQPKRMADRWASTLFGSWFKKSESTA